MTQQNEDADLTPLPLPESGLCQFVTFLSTQSLKYQNIKGVI